MRLTNVSDNLSTTASCLWFLVSAILLTTAPATMFAAVIGKDDREIISNDHQNREAQLANRIGSISIKNSGGENQSAGTGQLVQWDGKVYMLASVHGFFDLNGEPKFNQRTATWYPFTHYYNIDEDVGLVEIDFRIEPLNPEIAELRRDNLAKDVLIIKIDQRLPKTQLFGQEIGSSRLYQGSTENLISASENNDLHSVLIAEHDDFHDALEVGISRDCRFRTAPLRKYKGHLLYNKYLGLTLHDCDTGGNSSGTGIYIKQLDEHVLAGIHIIGKSTKTGGVFTQEEFNRSEDGNRFIPIDLIRQQFMELERDGKI